MRVIGSSSSHLWGLYLVAGIKPQFVGCPTGARTDDGGIVLTNPERYGPDLLILHKKWHLPLER
jgi:hypothetical protein